MLEGDKEVGSTTRWWESFYLSLLRSHSSLKGLIEFHLRQGPLSFLIHYDRSRRSPARRLARLSSSSRKIPPCSQREDRREGCLHQGQARRLYQLASLSS